MDTISVAKVAIVDSLSAVVPNVNIFSQVAAWDWGLIISIITLFSGIFMFLKYDKRLKAQEERLNAQQEQINEYNLESIQRDKEDRKKAMIRANMIRGDRGKRPIKVWNEGQADAFDVNVEILDGKSQSFFCSNQNLFPYSKLSPKMSTEWRLIMCGCSYDKIDVKLTWRDECSDCNEYIQTLTV